MTATDELRRLLDERVVEWRVGDYPTTCTVWESDGIVWYGLWRDGCIELIAWQVTPEQAIEATLGRGTCHETVIDHYWRGCGSCGYIWEFMYGIGKCERPHWCPNCGRRVEP